MYADIALLRKPADLCAKFDGGYHGDKVFCTVDLTHSEGFLKHVTGLDTPAQLCTQADGTFFYGNCMVDAASWGQASLEVQRTVCGVRGGLWGGDGCALLS